MLTYFLFMFSYKFFWIITLIIVLVVYIFGKSKHLIAVGDYFILNSFLTHLGPLITSCMAVINIFLLRLCLSSLWPIPASTTRRPTEKNIFTLYISIVKHKLHIKNVAFKKNIYAHNYGFCKNDIYIFKNVKVANGKIC